MRDGTLASQSGDLLTGRHAHRGERVLALGVRPSLVHIADDEREPADQPWAVTAGGLGKSVADDVARFDLTGHRTSFTLPNVRGAPGVAA